MKVIRGIKPDLLRGSVVTMGMFDGVHFGHQTLLRECRRHADRLGLPVVMLTYAPHPLQVLRPEVQLRTLTPLPEKLERLAQQDVDVTLVAKFTLAFSQFSADRFIHEVLVGALHPRMLVIGYRSTFGHSREGNVDMLRMMGATLGFAVEVLAPVEVAGGPVSSSRVRKCLDDGDVAQAAELLGYRYQLTGKVVRGDERGRELGFPTANLLVPPEKMAPADGVYAVQVCLPKVTRQGVMNIGGRPTFDRPRSLEVHLLDFTGDLYDQPLTVTFLSRLRDVQSFPDAGALRRQIEEDIRRVKGEG